MAEIKRKTKKKSQGAFLRDSIMTGISYMIPVIVGAGVIQAIAKALGGYDIGNHMDQIDTIAKAIMLLGQNMMNYVVPVIAAFIAYAMADKPGLAPGFVMGALAGAINTGFVGGVVGGIMVGYFVLMLKKIKVPKAIQGIMPILVYPVVTTLVCGLLMYYVVGRPISWFMAWLTSGLMALSGGSRFVLGAVFLIPTSAKMCAGMTSPLGIGLACFIGGKKKFTEAEREQAKSLFILSCCYVQEGVIPFLMKDPVRVAISCCTGGAITGGLCMMLGLESPAVHGGAFVIAMTSNPLLFIGLWRLGGCITGVLYAVLRRPLPEGYVESEEDIVSII